ncbi:hypothetical protein LY90DRAFT_208707 [Neocallimastix californiae]|uniref:Uncharacterized protein n=1 Tax=Neocallimastix californiae TaxID=1754190 RepID=A0A1Y1Z8G5_9FUNG|nr:hypothetical protein LY90DRAFT_208707 [Neocallimastix californiae]|eukprot:ORY06543.1 hypothetical protein LY90DRAFT_208707 [Neocallimastix californiae]
MSSLKPPATSANINRTARRKQVNYSALYDNGKLSENSNNSNNNSYGSNTVNGTSTKSSIINNNSNNYLFNNVNNKNTFNSYNNSNNNNINNNNNNIINDNSINNTNGNNNRNLTRQYSINKSSSLLNNNLHYNEQQKKVTSGYNNYYDEQRSILKTNSYNNYGNYLNTSYNSSNQSTYSTQNSNSNQISELQKINKDLMKELEEVKNELIICQNENKKLKEINDKMEKKLVSFGSSEGLPKSFENISKSLEEIITKKNLLEKQLKDHGIEPIIYSEKQTSNEEDNKATEPSQKQEPQTEENNEKDIKFSIDNQRKKFEEECQLFTQSMSEKDDIINKLMSEIQSKTNIFTNLVNDAKNRDNKISDNKIVIIIVLIQIVMKIIKIQM